VLPSGLNATAVTRSACPSAIAAVRPFGIEQVHGPRRGWYAIILPSAEHARAEWEMVRSRLALALQNGGHLAGLHVPIRIVVSQLPVGTILGSQSDAVNRLGSEAISTRSLRVLDRPRLCSTVGRSLDEQVASAERRGVDAGCGVGKPWPSSCPVSGFHNLTVVSQLDVASRGPSGKRDHFDRIVMAAQGMQRSPRLKVHTRPWRRDFRRRSHSVCRTASNTPPPDALQCPTNSCFWTFQI